MTAQQLSVAQSILNKIEPDLNDLQPEGHLWLVEQLIQRLRVGKRETLNVREKVMADVERKSCGECRDMAATILIPTIDEVAAINRRMIETFGGFFVSDPNFKNRGSLEHALWQAEAEMFGSLLYPTAIERAGLIGWRIVTGHIFHDGNKRTGMEVSRLTLWLNDIQMKIDQETVDVAMKVAQDGMTQEQFTEWLRTKS